MEQTLEKATKSKVQKMKDIISPELHNELICQEVMDRLGIVNNFFKIEAHNVFDNHWRVNVWVEVWTEESTGCGYKIEHSYFITIKNDCIEKSSPELPPKF